jgi:hypothetical protein
LGKWQKSIAGYTKYFGMGRYSFFAILASGGKQLHASQCFVENTSDGKRNFKGTNIARLPIALAKASSHENERRIAIVSCKISIVNPRALRLKNPSNRLLGVFKNLASDSLAKHPRQAYMLTCTNRSSEEKLGSGK